jgi:hypothetical protein
MTSNLSFMLDESGAFDASLVCDDTSGMRPRALGPRGGMNERHSNPDDLNP